MGRTGLSDGTVWDLLCVEDVTEEIGRSVMKWVTGKGWYCEKVIGLDEYSAGCGI
jgi:hypothetical protein